LSLAKTCSGSRGEPAPQAHSWAPAPRSRRCDHARSSPFHSTGRHDTSLARNLHHRQGRPERPGTPGRPAGQPQPLLPHDVICVGSIRFVFEMDVATDTPPPTPPAAEPDVPPLAPEEPDAATQVLGETRVGRYLPVFLEPPEESAPSSHLAPPTLPGAARRIAELEQQLAELRAQLAKKQGEG
jgi:hypothetical protein